MGCCQSKWRRHEQPTYKIEDRNQMNCFDKYDMNQKFQKFDYIKKSKQAKKAKPPKKLNPPEQVQNYETSFGQQLIKPMKPIQVEVIEPSLTHSDLIHQMEIKESVPAEIFANMNNLEDCFKNSQVESKA